MTNITQVAPIDHKALLSPRQLLNARVQYRHFETTPELYTGIIREVKQTKFGVQVRIQPDANQTAHLLKWRSLKHDVVGWAWRAAQMTSRKAETAGVS